MDRYSIQPVGEDTIPVAQIHVPSDRIRNINEDHAAGLAESIAQSGQMHRILLNLTPNGQQTYTLIAGAHRVRAKQYLAEWLGEEQSINAVIFRVSKEEALLLEIEENYFRNELTCVARARALGVYRDTYEKANGAISRGRPKKGQTLPNFSDSPIGQLEDRAKKGISQLCAEQFGLSTRSVKYLAQIAKLPKPVLDAVADTPVANNQNQLLKLAKMSPKKLAKFPAAFKETKDFQKSLEVLEPPERKKPDEELKQLEGLIMAWKRATLPGARAKFLTFADLMEAPKAVASEDGAS